MGGTFETLSFSDIVTINRRMTEEFGGLSVVEVDNLLNPATLDHVLAEIDAYLFGVELYPDIFQKAALIAWRINTGHVFFDGNKRTSMEACRQFLEANNYILKVDSETVVIARKIAKHEIDFNDFVEWLHTKTVVE